jgi:hypothetical protein
MRRLAIALLLVCNLSTISLRNASAEESARTVAKTDGDSTAVLQLAETVGLKSEFNELFKAEPGTVERELVEAKLLRHLWQAELEFQRVLTEIEEEKTVVAMTIERVENHQTRIANALASMSFLSHTVVSLPGNGIFIPAPPPRPEIPNILFSTAFGISTGLGVLSLAAIQDHKVSFNYGKQSMLAPLLTENFSDARGGRVWHFLNYSSEPSEPTLRQKLLASWRQDNWAAANSQSMGADVAVYGLGDEAYRIKLSKLRVRLAMLNELQNEMMRMSISLSKLGHCM